MKKYYIGLIALTILTLGFAVFTGVKGAAQRQDKETETKAQEISKQLNSYINKNKKLPETLEEAGIKNFPSTIKYTKESESRFKFCETYKNESSYTDTSIWGLISGASLSNYDNTSYDDYGYDSDEYAIGSLYPSYSHKEGENCQAVEPYILKSSYNNSTYSSNTTTITSSSVRARDTERQTDIKAIHGQIEAYYAQNGRYPTLANMNDAAFRSTNLKGLDVGALKDPSGISTNITGKPARNVYSYDVQRSGGGTCDNSTNDCAQYTLTATLEGGGTYTKSNLN